MKTLGQLLSQLSGARVVGQPHVAITRVHTDTRSLQPGDLFVALKGERFDAQDFLPQAAAQGALSARPVLATAQTLGVPFGQPAWGEALMDKMLWASSQNLRSVEIRLDPAELGPLEIHIQSLFLHKQSIAKCSLEITIAQTID